MPQIDRAGARLHYEDRGTGDPVILHHALTADGTAWDAIGLSARLTDAGFRVIVPDALGHGRSGDATPERVGLDARVADVLAITDHLGIERFHFAGYSMGGWIGTGLIQASPERLLSVVIAGWDPVDGARRFTDLIEIAPRRDEFVRLVAKLMALTPGRASPSAARIGGYADTYEQLFQDIPSIVSLIGRAFPLLLAVGIEDRYAATVRVAADALAVDLLEVPGDHVGAFFEAALSDGLSAWLTGVRQR